MYSNIQWDFYDNLLKETLKQIAWQNYDEDMDERNSLGTTNNVMLRLRDMQLDPRHFKAKQEKFANILNTPVFTLTRSRLTS